MILVVDDDPDIVKLLSEVLSGSGYTVQTAKDGVEAFAHLQTGKCKCLLLDITMPRLNGVELLLLMQAEGIHVPTIVMAGFDDFTFRSPLS